MGIIPCLNHVFEEFGIHHEEHKVLVKVLRSNKEKKIGLKNTTDVVKAKKRKGTDRGKQLARRGRLKLPLPAMLRRWKRQRRR